MPIELIYILAGSFIIGFILGYVLGYFTGVSDKTISNIQ